MRRLPLPLPADQEFLRVIAGADGWATVYDPGDTLPADELRADPAPLLPLSARQIRMALRQAGLREAVEAAVAAAGGDLVDWWEYSIEYHREHHLVADMAASIGATPEQVDAVWRLGASL